METPLSLESEKLHGELIRNFLEVPREHFVREPLYDSSMARVSDGTVARKLGCGVDTLPPGKTGAFFGRGKRAPLIQRDGDSIDYWDGEP